jgi:hypothetical protein
MLRAEEVRLEERGETRENPVAVAKNRDDKRGEKR